MLKPTHIVLCAAVALLATTANSGGTGAVERPELPPRAAVTVVTPSSPGRPLPCPAEMAHVSGSYCPDARQVCLRWMDPEGGTFSHYRCAEYANPATCVGGRRHLDFCIDRDEYAPRESDLPASEQSWTDATAMCTSLGKRVCLQSEWQFACEGEEMRPYPYGFVRDPLACNADLIDIYEAGRARIKDLRAKHGTHPKCESPFGVRDLSGNLEEFVTIDGSGPARPAMMGAWWQPSQNHCRARQTAHGPTYKGRETGFRCCAEVTEVTDTARTAAAPR